MLLLTQFGQNAEFQPQKKNVVPREFGQNAEFQPRRNVVHREFGQNAEFGAKMRIWTKC
jgi:transposase